MRRRIRLIKLIWIHIGFAIYGILIKGQWIYTRGHVIIRPIGIGDEMFQRDISVFTQIYQKDNNKKYKYDE